MTQCSIPDGELVPMYVSGKYMYGLLFAIGPSSSEEESAGQTIGVVRSSKQSGSSHGCQHRPQKLTVGLAT